MVLGRAQDAHAFITVMFSIITMLPYIFDQTKDHLELGAC